MKTAAKKLTSSIFILLGLAPLLSFLIIILKQESIRSKMKEQMETQSLHSITLADNEIHWAKKGKEIWVDGKMFDIKSTIHKNGMSTFFGLFDEEETALNRSFSENWGIKLALQNQLLAQFFQNLQGIELNPSTEPFYLQDYPLQFNILPSSKLQSLFKTILTPPPQVWL